MPWTLSPNKVIDLACFTTGEVSPSDFVTKVSAALASLEAQFGPGSIRLGPVSKSAKQAERAASLPSLKVDSTSSCK